MKNILKYIGVLLIMNMCFTSCNEHIKMETMVVIKEETYNYYNDRSTSKSLYTIKYKSANMNNGLTIYVVADKDAFEVGDKLKLVKNND